MRLKHSHIIFLVFFLLFSCASEQQKTPTPEVQTTNKAFKLVQEIRDAFIRKNTQTLKQLCAESLYNEMVQQTSKFKDMSLELTMRWVDIEKDGSIHLYVAWKRTALLENKPLNDSGMAAFIIKNNPMIAEAILRENPFQ